MRSGFRTIEQHHVEFGIMKRKHHRAHRAPCSGTADIQIETGTPGLGHMGHHRISTKPRPNRHFAAGRTKRQLHPRGIIGQFLNPLVDHGQTVAPRRQPPEARFQFLPIRPSRQPESRLERSVIFQPIFRRRARRHITVELKGAFHLLRHHPNLVFLVCPRSAPTPDSRRPDSMPETENRRPASPCPPPGPSRSSQNIRGTPRHRTHAGG
ncbi:hypothetical protein SDC9_123262 [bioreactor metagenome]|uniref:Uncharacterized protein n=1 Tax=bioreactor metagenome TaxID=1076179 RepID=A0A645CH58_9ZZZZ